MGPAQDGFAKSQLACTEFGLGSTRIKPQDRSRFLSAWHGSSMNESRAGILARSSHPCDPALDSVGRTHRRPHWPSPSSRVRFAVALSLYSSLLPPARESYTRSLLRFPLSSRFASRLCDRQGLRRTRRRPGIHRRESFALPCRKPGYIPTLTFSGPRITGITSLSPFNGGKSWIL